MTLQFNGDINKVIHFVNVCCTFPEDIDVRAGRYVVDGKSILGLCGICTLPNLEAVILTDQRDRYDSFAEAIKEFT